MKAEAKVKDAMARYHRAAGMLRVAGVPTPPPAAPPQEGAPGGGDSPGASAGTGMERNIPKGHAFDPTAIKPLAKMLWAMSISMGHALTAYRVFTKLKSSSFSPDGLLGGRGYVLSVKDVRKRLYDACEALSQISDTIHDEVNGDHWKPQLKDLGENDAEDVQKYLDEADEILENPEKGAEDESAEMEAENDGPDGTPNESRWAEEDSSTLPNGGDGEAGQGHAKTVRERVTKQANSSVAPSTLPGPRVQHIQPEHGYGPYGSENQGESTSGDPWGQTEGVGAKNPYAMDEGPLDPIRAAVRLALRGVKPAQSGMPTDFAPRDGNDYGLGYGATGTGIGVVDKGGPGSGLPRDPSGPTNPTDRDALPHNTIEKSSPTTMADSSLPNDGEDPVCRSDYFDGPKGNFGTGSPAASTALPGDGEAASYNYDRDYPYGGGYQQSRIDNQFVERPSR